MDNRNLFETSTTYRLLRLEYFVTLLVCIRRRPSCSTS
jgi:hypothetical protein